MFLRVLSVARRLKTHPNCWSGSAVKVQTSLPAAGDWRIVCPSWLNGILILSYLSQLCIIPSFFFSAVCSYLFLPHCSLITPLPLSQSFLIRLFKFLKPVSLFHNSWYAILQPLPSPDLIFTGFVPHHNISFCPSYLLSCPSLSLQINLSFFLFHCFSPTFSSFFFYQNEKLTLNIFFYLLLDEFFP